MTKQSVPSADPARPRAGPSAYTAVEFIGSFPDPLTRLDPPLPEIAFLGRSNVGKSSLLNALVGRRDIARVSSTPGKTQTMNVFRVASDPRPYYLIDLPGYGYAKVNKGERQRFRSLVERYVGERPTVTAVVWLLDARREPSDDDGKLHELLMRSERPVLAVLTKADKLGREAQRTQHRAIAQSLGLLEDQVELTSSETGLGISELRDSIAALLGSGKDGPDEVR
ncbi:MAG: ribosome biogenesis GTP-binding protein YihA/YsxC [Gemmatimonadales bacterium]